MNVLFDDEVYENVASAFQCVLIDALNRALKAHGIDDADVRQQICTTYLFETGALVDQDWIKAKAAKRVFPRVCFVDRRLEEDAEADAKATVYLPAGGFEFHSYAHGSVGYYFDDCKERLKGVKTGE